MLPEDIIRDRKLEEELQQRTLKIKQLFRHGLQHSSTVFIPEDKVSEESFRTLIDPQEIEEKAKEAEHVFQETLANVMGQKQLPQYLYELLQQRQNETTNALKYYDDIILLLKEDLNEQDRQYRKRIERQSGQRELLQKRTEDFISELIRVGNEEISAARHAIISHTKESSNAIYEKTRHYLDESAADQPFDPYSWKAPSEMLAFEELNDIFIQSQEDIFQMRRELLSEVCELLKNLEKEKMDYALKREKYSKELFDLERDYKSKMPLLTKIKRQIIQRMDQKRAFSKELEKIQHQISVIYKKELAHAEKHDEKNLDIHKWIRNHQNKLSTKEKRVLQCKKSEVKMLVNDIVRTYSQLQELECGASAKCAYLPDFEKNEIAWDGTWDHFLSAVPGNELLNQVLQIMEDYWMYTKTLSKLCAEKSELEQQNSELKIWLTGYDSFCA